MLPACAGIRAVCVMLPATGDQGFSQRMWLAARPLAAAGVLVVLPVAPLYGKRKPANQDRWYVREVHLMFKQAISIAVEAAALLHWAREQHGSTVPLAVTGISWGGAMAALAAQLYNGPLAVIPYMGCMSPGLPFAQGGHLQMSLALARECHRANVANRVELRSSSMCWTLPLCLLLSGSRNACIKYRMHRHLDCAGSLHDARRSRSSWPPAKHHNQALQHWPATPWWHASPWSCCSAFQSALRGGCATW